MPNASQFRQDEALVALGQAIRDARARHGISQEQLALIAGVDRSYVGRVERGDNNVAILTLLRIAGALDSRGSELLKRAGL